jgi:tetratricopeptide (TPR) repeat protein
MKKLTYSAFKSKPLLDKSFKLAQSQINHHEVAALAYRALSQAYLYSGQFQKASEAIDKALNLDSKDKESYLIRGLAMHQLRQGGAGLIQAYQMEPPTYRSMLELYRYYLEMQRLNDAKQVAHKIIKTFPLRYEGALFAMRIAAKQNNFSEALSLGEQAVLLESDNIPLHIELAQLYFDAQRPEKANELLRLLLTRSPKMPRDDLAKIYLILGKCNVNNRPQEAVIYFSQLLKWDVEPTSTLNYLGLAHYNLKEYQPSADYFARALRRTPDNLQIKFNLALTHFSAGSFNRAEQLFQEIRTVEPRHEEATLYLANVYDKKGDRLKAIEIFEKVLAINPNNVLAQKQMQRLKSGQ